MELYYKDLISKEASLEKLVDDLLNAVQGVDEYAQTAEAALPDPQKEEITSRLQRLKEGCGRIRQHAVSSARATDKIVRQNPYVFAGFAFALGLLTGALVGHGCLRHKRRDDHPSSVQGLET